MKIIIGALSFALLLLGIRHLDVHFDNQALEKELTHRQALHELQLEEQKKQYLKTIEGLEQFLVFNHTSNTQPQGGNRVATSSFNTFQNTAATNSLQTFAHIRDESLQRAVNQKYAFILGNLSLSRHDEDRLHQLLLERERILGTPTVGYHSTAEEIANNLRQQQELIAEIDYKITQLLDPSEVAQYELLKDSGFEQYQMNVFYENMGGNQTVPQESQRKLLLAKLEQKQQFSRWMQEFNTDLEHAPPAQREVTLQKMHQALHDYKDNYLSHARALLTQEQFDSLREFEQQQYQEMWNSLEAEWQTRLD